MADIAPLGAVIVRLDDNDRIGAFVLHHMPDSVGGGVEAQVPQGALTVTAVSDEKLRQER